MRSTVEIEDIEGMRQREGIDDVELREAVARLVVGDLVRLTLLPAPGARAGETGWCASRPSAERTSGVDCPVVPSPPPWPG